MAAHSGWFMPDLELLGISHPASLKDLHDQSNSLHSSSPSADCATPMILSASSYPELDAMTDNQQLGKPKRSRRKDVNARKTKTTADALPKKRGRPQKDADDATPAEKRRTQIRLAQRAYRSRQETAMAQQKDRIEELEAVIETMTETFIAFSDKLMRSKLLISSPELAQSLKEATAKYVMLSNQVSSLDEEHVASSHEQPSSLPPARATVNASPEPTMLSDKTSETGAVLKTDSTTSPSRNDTLQIFDGSPPHITFPSVYQNNLGPLMSHLYGPQSPFFSERLHWACSERAYKVLTNPNISNARLTRSFGYLMGRMSRAQIASFFGTVLHSFSAPEAFEQFNIPMLNLGGAGLHYPRKLPLTMSPYTLSRLPSGDEINALYGNIFTAKDFEEVWFDTEDLEGYLEEHGIILGSRDTVPEVTTQGPLGRMKVARLNIVSSVLGSSSRPNARRLLSESPILAVNESHLIDWLVLRAICLGRGAGFRKRDVEDYLLQHAWPIVTPQFPL